MTFGDGWTVWQATTPPIVTNSTRNKQCRWVQFQATNGLQAQMCVHEVSDFISEAVATQGRWPDNDVLTQQFYDAKPHLNAQPQLNGIFVDIEGNIGTCSLNMLLTTNAIVIAFEPHPADQFCLTNTIACLPKLYQDRFTLVPVALGDVPGMSVIHAAAGNLGYSVVGTPIEDNPKQAFYEAVPIAIVVLDLVLDINYDNAGSVVDLIQMDAQGFECRILDGMPQILAHTKAIHTEVADFG